MTSSTMQIRLAGLSDAPDLAAFAAQTFRDKWLGIDPDEDVAAYIAVHFTEERLQEEIQAESIYFLLAIDENELIGYCKLQVGHQPESELLLNPACIQKLYTLKRIQGKGVGLRLLTATVDLAKAQMCQVIWLGVWTLNFDAIRFYERNGFQIFGTHKFIMGAGASDDYLMKRYLF